MEHVSYITTTCFVLLFTLLQTFSALYSLFTLFRFLFSLCLCIFSRSLTAVIIAFQRRVAVICRIELSLSRRAPSVSLIWARNWLEICNRTAYNGIYHLRLPCLSFRRTCGCLCVSVWPTSWVIFNFIFCLSLSVPWVYIMGDNGVLFHFVSFYQSKSPSNYVRENSLCLI